MDSVTCWTTRRLLKVCICCLRSAACLAVSRFTCTRTNRHCIFTVLLAVIKTSLYDTTITRVPVHYFILLRFAYLKSARYTKAYRYCVLGRPFIKRFALCHETVVCLSVCLSVCPVLSCLYVCGGPVLWPKSWMDQDETRRASRPRPRPHCARWGPSSPSPIKGHVYCGQTAGWIKMALGMQVGLDPSDIVLERGPSSPSPKKGAEPPPTFRPMFIVAKWLDDQDATWHDGRPRPGQHYVRCQLSFTPRGRSAQFFGPCL